MRRRKSLADRARGAWGMIVFASLTHSMVAVYPAARDAWDLARGVTINGALPRVDADADISAALEPWAQDGAEGRIWSAANPVPDPSHPPAPARKPPLDQTGHNRLVGRENP